MAVTTAIDFKRELKQLFEFFDRQEFDRINELFRDDAQGIDEISRKWLRGRSAMNGYFDQLKEMGIGDIKTRLSDVVVKHWDDVALVTAVAEQTYRADGETVAITAPISALYRHDGSDWKIELMHAVALPEEE